MRFLDNFFRRSPHADIILQYRNSVLIQRTDSRADEQGNDIIDPISNNRVDRLRDKEHSGESIEEEYDI